jgi:hypothetical protein
MRRVKARELMSLYIAPDETWLTPEDRRVLEAHMAVLAGNQLQERERPDFPVRGPRRVVAQL